MWLRYAYRYAAVGIRRLKMAGAPRRNVELAPETRGIVTMGQAMDDQLRGVDDIIDEIRETPTFGPASDRDACQYWANIAHELANAVEQERVGRA